MRFSFVLIGLVIITVKSIDGRVSSATEDLHHFMEEEELEYYFGNKDNIPEYEVVDLPKNIRKREFVRLNEQNREPDDGSMKLDFMAFSKPISLHLRPNRNLVSPHMRAVKISDDGAEMISYGHNGTDYCHYLHADEETVAALSNCFGDEISGIILLPNSTLEVQPLNDRLMSVLRTKRGGRKATLLRGDQSSDMYDNDTPYTVPHIIKRAYRPSYYDNDFVDHRFADLTENIQQEENEHFLSKFPGEPPSVRKLTEQFMNSRMPMIDEDYLEIVNEEDNEVDSGKLKGSKEIILTVEVALFFDEAAYKKFKPHLGTDAKVRDMLLAYMNAVQAIYHHPSLKTPVDIVIVYMELMRTQPYAMPHHSGERGQLLDSFCEYQEKKNPNGDKNPGHWDMGLYVSGLDFYAIENGRHSGSTMGLATVGGVCLNQYACVIAEFGVTNAFGKPYPSAGFTSVYILAHEIGHNLGMNHDGTRNNCPTQGFIMSPSRGTDGETSWSSCSANVIEKLEWAKCLYDKPSKLKPEYDAWKFDGHPGLTYTAKQQCEILLMDKDAEVAQTNGLSSICNNLQCRTPHRSGYYYAGPALMGTYCGILQWCDQGSCVFADVFNKPNAPQKKKGGWSQWKTSSCISGCINKSKGYVERRRDCDNPKPVNTDEGCEGPSFDIILCKDDFVVPLLPFLEICGNKKVSPFDYATKKCKEFSKRLPELDKNGLGLQAPHESNRLWMGCAIFCRRTDTGSYYTPRLDLNDMGVDPYFPDGTWCHNDGTQDFFCLQHHCLPESFKFSKNDIWTMGEDVPIPGNAQSHPELNEKLIQYLSVDDMGKPLLTSLNPDDFNLINDWSDKDYVDLPKDARL